METVNTNTGVAERKESANQTLKKLGLFLGENFLYLIIVVIFVAPLVWMVLGSLREEKEIFAGMGSACSAHSKEPSKILMGMGLTKEQARCSLRISFSQDNTITEIEKFLNAFAEAYKILLPTFKDRARGR